MEYLHIECSKLYALSYVMRSIMRLRSHASVLLALLFWWNSVGELAFFPTCACIMLDEKVAVMIISQPNEYYHW
jgi:hypothetical protein